MGSPTLAVHTRKTTPPKGFGPKRALSSPNPLRVLQHTLRHIGKQISSRCGPERAWRKLCRGSLVLICSWAHPTSSLPKLPVKSVYANQRNGLGCAVWGYGSSNTMRLVIASFVLL